MSFKKEWVEPILSGEKTDSIRQTTRLKVGDMVAAKCEWTKPPFAYLEVVAVESIDRAKLPRERRERLAKMYEGDWPLVRVAFRRVTVPGDR